MKKQLIDFSDNSFSQNETIISNSRHQQELSNTLAEINAVIDGIFNSSIEINGIGIVSAKYKEIKELFTERRVLNFSIIF